MSKDLEKLCPDFSRLRLEYQQRSLSEHEIDRDPLRQFLRWLNEAIDVSANEPNAMALATSTRAGVPSVRLVLLKSVNADGLAFFTNYLSQKGHELEQNPHAAAVFWWPELQRQVRIEGEVRRTGDAESDQYFGSRPLEARIGAAASPQSQPLESRGVLERLFAEIQDQHPDGKIPRPAHWGGYRLRPRRFEFWQGRPSRLHDRIEYMRGAQDRWIIRRLAP